MKTKQIKKTMLALTVITALSVVGCGQKSDDKNKAGKLKVQTNANMSSDELTLAAEQLVSPYTFMLAYKVAKSAYDKNPNDLKAEFYMRMLKRFEAFRGVAARMRGALNSEQLAKHDRWVKEFPESPLKKFITESGQPINTVADMQKVLDEYFQAVREFRNFLKINQAAKFELYMNPHQFQEEIRNELVNSCVAVELEGGLDVECDFKDIAVKKLNSADLLVLRQLTAGELLYSVYNSYTLDGLDRPDFELLSPREKAEYLSKSQGFGHLRQGHIFSLLKEIGSDLSASVKWAAQYQAQLCPAGYEVESQRKGYLYDEGICVGDEQEPLQMFIATLDRALGGITQMDFKTQDGQAITTKVDAFAWTKAPIQNLRHVMPNQWNNCDEATSLVDNTLGGIFVENNVNQFLQKSCE